MCCCWFKSKELLRLKSHTVRVGAAFDAILKVYACEKFAM